MRGYWPQPDPTAGPAPFIEDNRAAYRTMMQTSDHLWDSRSRPLIARYGVSTGAQKSGGVDMYVSPARCDAR